MGALGNGRRVGRSPPLLIAALTTCILVLGFNYWVSNSRNTELQAQVYELEARVRRGEAEREDVSQKWGEAEQIMQRQSQQIRELEEQHQRQEATLHINVSSCSKTVQDMKSQLKSLFADLGKIQQELNTCQNSVNTLNKKLTYDTAQCNTQMLALKEDCNERVAAAVKGAQKKQEKNVQPNLAVTQKDAPLTVDNLKTTNEDSANETAEKSAVPTQLTEETQPDQDPDLTELKTNEIVVINDGAPSTPKTPAVEVKDNVIAPELGGDLSVIGQKDEQPPKATADPDVAKAAKLSLTEEDALMPGEGPVEYTEETEANNTENEGALDLDGYEENEPEAEDDKQAALAQN